MFSEGLTVHHALVMGDYVYLGRWARYSLCGTARYSCAVCTVWATGPFFFGTARHNCPVCTIGAIGPCDVVASVVFPLFVLVLTFLVVTSLFTR